MALQNLETELKEDIIQDINGFWLKLNGLH